jgi:hypothetical protein
MYSLDNIFDVYSNFNKYFIKKMELKINLHRIFSEAIYHVNILMQRILFTTEHTPCFLQLQGHPMAN